MFILSNVVRRLRRAGGAAAGFIASTIKLGARVATRLTALLALFVVGLAVTAVRYGLIYPLATLGVDVTRLPVVGQITALVNAGARVQTRILQFLVGAAAGGRLVRISYDLVRRVGANAVAQTAVGGRSDWGSTNNALGRADGSTATIAGNALGARGGQLEFDYANALSKDALNIEAARVLVYLQVSSTLLDNADVQIKIDTGAGLVTRQTITGDLNALGAPLEFDVTADIASWSAHDGIRAAVSMESAALETYSVALDAVEFEITASRVDSFE